MRRISALLAVAVLAACVRPASVPQPARPVWRALGTEPFWNVEVAGDLARHTTPETPDAPRFAVRRTLLPGGGEQVSGMAGASRFTLDLARGPCSDGMSDHRYDWTARLVIGDTRLQGCAIAGPACEGNECPIPVAGEH